MTYDQGGIKFRRSYAMYSRERITDAILAYKPVPKAAKRRKRKRIMMTKQKDYDDKTKV